jgi:ribulose-5-phosphate 4-epimerase/fuculose-1-phosphate aldolase
MTINRSDQEALREAIATACQIMSEQGLVEHVLGHISARVSAGELLVRCRGPLEKGLAYTTADDVHCVSVDGPADIGAWTVPNELPIHTELMRRRAAVSAVVHAHPPAVVALSLVGADLLPIYGAYDIPGAQLAAGGIPVWHRSALVATAELATEMVSVLGERPVIVLRGHGLVSVAEGPAERAIAHAVLQAIAVERLARTTLTILQAGATPRPISDDDLAALPDLGGGFTIDTMWRHLQRRAADRVRA